MPYVEQLRSTDLPDWVRLGYFLADTDELVRDILSAGWLFFDEGLRLRIHNAHRSMRNRVFSRSVNIDENWQVPSDLAPKVWPRNYGEAIVEQLEKEGLLGDELDAKLEGYARARRSQIQSGGGSALRRTLRWMKAILQSLGSAFPPAAAILELVELIENGAKDVEELVRDGTL